MNARLCADCGESPILARGRCNRCYQRHLKALKRSESFASLSLPRPTIDRLLDKAVPGWGGCIIWTGQLDRQGYGRMDCSLAHRVAYECLVGPIPKGAPIDHVCHNRDKTCLGGRICLHRRCINPHHLEQVTYRENLLRSSLTIPAVFAARTHCDIGHPYDEANTYRRPGSRARVCKACRRQYDAQRRASMKTGGAR